MLEDRIPADTLTLACINYYGDNVIIFHAVECTTSTSQISSVPAVSEDSQGLRTQTSVDLNESNATHVEREQNESRADSVGTEARCTVTSQSPYVPPTRSPLAAAETSIQEFSEAPLQQSPPNDNQKGVQLLDELKVILDNGPSGNLDVLHWINQISTVKSQAAPSNTIIGVAGDTGAGKSSVINALLDDERLVPTNCMRACTAVVTEISFNESQEDSSRYRAEIEFIKQEDWAKELAVLLKDLLDQSGKISRDSQQLDSEAGIAYAKIKAVYPNKTKDELETIAQSGWERLLKDPSVQDILGTTKTIQESGSDRFYNRLQRYVDSKGQSSQDKSGKDRREKKMEFWPLIKVVRIFTTAPVLSTGAVIVDLPGVQDSNAARQAVCEGYIKRCTGLWIVAPIIRAVDNKAAKDLLGESFKRQLKYDGTYGNITFICSKTDDISITEASSAFGLDETMSDSFDRATQLESLIEEAETDRAKHKRTLTRHQNIVEAIDERIERWEDRKRELAAQKLVYDSSKEDEEDLDEGENSFDSFEPRKKRKRSSTIPPGSHHDFKKIRAGSDLSDEMISDNCSLNTDSEDDGMEERERDQEPGSPLTEKQVDDKLLELKERKNEARKRRTEIKKEVSQADQKVKELKKTKLNCESRNRAACIMERNRRSKDAIQQDFASGVKELDQDNAIEEDEDNFDPGKDLRDYDAVARSLPVFCISSRAYQKLSGRFRKDQDTVGFTNVDQTEVPQLKSHCHKLTEAVRADGCRNFLNSLNQLLNSLSLWSSNEGTEGRRFDAQKDEEDQLLQEQLQGLSESLNQCADACITEIKALMAQIFGRFGGAVDAAAHCATDTVERWGDTPNRDNYLGGGVPFPTYKALCHRDGVFTNARGKHDWNEQLYEYSAFTLDSRGSEKGASPIAIKTLTEQLRTYPTFLQSVGNRVTIAINDQQKEANRQFTPGITAALQSAYGQCANESGVGSFKRMKATMMQHVAENKDQMFGDAAATVQKQLRELYRNAEIQLKEPIDELLVRLDRDYRQMMFGPNISMDQQPHKWELEMKKRICELVASGGKGWEEITGRPDGMTMLANEVNSLVSHSDHDKGCQLEHAHTKPTADDFHDASAQAAIHREPSDFGEAVDLQHQGEKECGGGHAETEAESLNKDADQSNDNTAWRSKTGTTAESDSNDIAMPDIIDQGISTSAFSQLSMKPTVEEVPDLGDRVS
ncbi:MAG: hypothetical protein Q9165_002730 [Trypethelium subeluteriae]